MLFKNIKKHAFTLTEILVALAIVGVVSAVTVPTMMRNIDLDTKQKVALYTKTFNTIDQATKMILIKDTDGKLSLVGKFNNWTDLGPLYSKYIHFKKYCEANDTSCWSTGEGRSTSDQTAIGADGVLYDFWNGSSSCNSTCNALFVDENGNKVEKKVLNTCGYINVDVNGSKGPNTFGSDVFRICIGRTGTKL